MMFDAFVLAIAVVIIVVAVNPRLRIMVGRRRPAIASRSYKLAFILPLGAIMSVVALVRLLGYLSSNRCHECFRITYSLASTPYVGWVLTFIGLSGVRTLASIQDRMTRALVLVSIICGPFLICVGLYEIVLRMRG